MLASDKAEKWVLQGDILNLQELLRSWHQAMHASPPTPGLHLVLTLKLQGVGVGGGVEGGPVGGPGWEEADHLRAQDNS